MEVSVVPFDRRRHWKFAEAEAMNAAEKWPHSLRHEPWVKHRLADQVWAAAEGNPAGAWVAVMPEDHDLFVGFLVSPATQAIAYAYVKFACRRLRVASRLAAAAGIDLRQPTAVTIWSPAASRIAAAGKYRLYPAIPGETRK